MVLAAGVGHRMRPLSELMPKPALPVLNRPMIAHTLEHLAAHGVQRAVINAHHLSEILELTVTRWAPKGLTVTFSRESKILGTAGGIRKASRHFKGEPFFVANADSLSDADLTAAAAAHAASGHAATMIVRPHDERYRPVQVSASDEIVGIGNRSWGGDPSTPRTFSLTLESRSLRSLADITASRWRSFWMCRKSSAGSAIVSDPIGTSVRM